MEPIRDPREIVIIEVDPFTECDHVSGPVIAIEIMKDINLSSGQTPMAFSMDLHQIVPLEFDLAHLDLAIAEHFRDRRINIRNISVLLNLFTTYEHYELLEKYGGPAETRTLIQRL